MNLLEYEAKLLLRGSDIPTPNSEVLHQGTTPTATPPLVLKSQVPTGGRGKLGGIKVVDNGSFLDILADLFSHPIKGFLPQSILAEEKLEIDREFYLSILINRPTSSIQLIAHRNGGVEVEENDIDEFIKLTLTDNFDTVGEQIAELYEIPEQTFVLQELIKNLHACFIKNDATLIEINPLILTNDARLIAGDCKVVLDDAASFRHPEWNFEEQKAEANFVTLNRWGDVATIANGAGLAMATVDAVANAGMHPANFLDIGGGASAESVMKAFKRIMEYQNVKVILINIFAGITRCDEVAKAIIEARQHINSLPPLCIRLAGTNYEQAASLLEAENITLLPTLDSCLQSAKEYTL